jgi:outer membrane protein insertion porin family
MGETLLSRTPLSPGWAALLAVLLTVGGATAQAPPAESAPGAVPTAAAPAAPPVPPSPPAPAPEAPRNPCEDPVAIPGGLLPEPEIEASGPPVVAIEIRSEAALAEKELEEIGKVIDVEIGQPLGELAVRHTLRNLQATGTFDTTELYTEESAEGLTVYIVLAPAYQVRKIELVGNLGLDSDEIHNVLPQKESQPLFEEQLVNGVFEVQELYRANGYFKASVQLQPRLDEAARLADVTYRLDSGPRAKVGTVSFAGNTGPFTPEALIERLRIKPGEPYRQATSETDIFRLRRFLLGQGYRSARIEKPAVTPREGAEVVDLSIPIEVGKRLEWTVAGADAKKLEKNDLLLFLGDQGYDDALVIQSVSRIRTYYQGQGYFHAKVTQEEEVTPEVVKLRLTVEPGERYTLESIEFTGNKSYSSAELQKLMATSPPTLLARLNPGQGRLVDQALQSDLKNVRSFYARSGFEKVKVGPEQVREEGLKLHLTLPIEEGAQERVVSLDLDALCSLDKKALRRQLKEKGGLADGGSFHPVVLNETLDFIRAEYESAGYSQAQVSALSDWNPDHTLVDVKLQVFEGPRQVVDRVIVRGNEVTDGDVIRRTAKIRRGDPISRVRLQQIESDLSRLGLFSRVDVEAARVDFGSPLRDVVLHVEEGLQHSLNYGVGYDTEDGARGLLGYSFRNLWGKAVTLRSDLRLSQRNQRFRLLLDQPTVGALPVSLSSSLFYIDADDKNRRIRRWGFRTEAAEVRSRRRRGTVRYSLAYDFRVLQLISIDPGVALNDFERRKSRPYQISSVIPSLFFDRRDNALDPHRGGTSLVQLQYSFPFVGSDADFLKLSLQQTETFDLGRPGVIAVSLRVGGIEAFRVLPGKDPDLPDDLPSSDVFIDERFFAGGETTHRAYGRDELTLLGQSRIFSPETGSYQVVGGNGLLLFNADYRFPLYKLPVDGVVFFDTGNVWADWRRIDLRQTKSGAGVGVRYVSPIGPLRLEIAWKLDRDRQLDESPYRILFSLGNPF